MRKILFVSSIFVNLFAFRRGLMTALREQGYEVAAACGRDGYEEDVAALGVKTICLQKLTRGTINPAREFQALSELYRLYRQERPALILHYTIKPVIYGSLAAALARVPTICTITGGGYLYINQVMAPAINLLYKVALSCPRRVFFQNRDDLEFFVSGGLVNPRKIHLVPGSGVDLDYYRPWPAAPDPAAPLTFLFIGRLLWDKGLKEYVEAAAAVRQRFPGVRFWMLGRLDPGNPAAVPEAVVRVWEKEAGLEWLGAVKDVRPIIGASDVVVLPSYREGLPRSLLEAMAMAKPIITTTAIGCREVIDDGVNGFAVPPRDAPALAAAMLRMAQLEPGAREAMGQAGRRKASREFAEPLVLQQYLAAIADLLGPAAGRRV